MKKQTKTLCLLAGVLVLCAAAYLGLLLWNGGAEEREAAAANYVAQMENLGGITVERDGTTTAYTKGTDQAWTVADRGDFPLQQSYLTALEDTLGALTAVKTISDPEGDASYGLDAPACTVTAESTDGTVWKLLMGSEINGNYYARLDGESTVYTISSDLMDETGYSLLDMVERDSIPTVTEDSFVSLALTKDGETHFYAKDEIEDNETLDTAVNYLAALTFNSCWAWDPTDEQLAEAGLDAPATLTVVHGEDESTYTLELGSADGNGRCYARLKDSRQINLLSSTWVEGILALAETTPEE